MKPNTITVEWLKKQGACSSMIERFSEVWPYGAEVNEENIRRAQQERFDLDWFASHYLTAQAYSAYDEALITANRAYQKAMIPAKSAFDEAVASALIKIISK